MKIPGGGDNIIVVGITAPNPAGVGLADLPKIGGESGTPGNPGSGIPVLVKPTLGKEENLAI